MAARPVILGPLGPFREAKEAFASGGIIAYPTETFYGLCVDPFNGKAIEALFLLKGRPPEAPIPVIVKDIPMLDMVALEVPPMARRLMERFWPGPLTIVLKARPEVPQKLTAGTGTIGVRVSSNPAAALLTAELASPITATSANPSGKRPAAEPGEVIAYFDGSIDVLIDGGALAGKKGSTVVDATGKEPVIIREGEIPKGEVLSWSR